MSLPTMPSTHTWVQLGPGFSKVGNSPQGGGVALFVGDDAEVWVWDEETNIRVTDLLDANGNPTSTVPVHDGWVGDGNPPGIGVPVAVAVPSFSVGQFGKRMSTLPVQTLKTAAASLAPTAAQIATVYNDTGSTFRTDLDADLNSTFARTGADGLGIHVEDGADTATLNAALTSAATLGAVVLVGSHTLTASLSVPTGATLRGRNNESKLTLPAGATFPAVDIDGKTDVKIERLRITRAGGTAANACAVRVRGNVDRISITDVRAESLNSGFRIVGGEGSTPGTCKRVILTRCHATSSDVYGYWVDDVDGLEMAHCTSNVSGLDGVKFRKLTKNKTITGGWYTGAIGGDGMDAYAGGEDFTVQGTSFSGNTINGATIKCDDLNKSDPTNYGLPGNITLSGIRCNNNGGNGLGIHRNGSTDDATEPLVKRVTVLGGTYNGNAGHGQLIRARQVSLMGPLCANNQGNAIRVEPTAFDISIHGPQCAGNGRRDAVTDGISVAGQRVSIFGGTSIGSDPDGATSDADLAAGTKYQRFGLRLESTATGAIVVGLTLKHNSLAPLSDSTNDSFIQLGTGGDSVLFATTLPNNKKVGAHRTDNTVSDLFWLDAGNNMNLGDSDQTALNVWAAKFAPQGDLAHAGTKTGFNGKAPVVKAADPGVATGTDAAVINAVVTALRNVGLVT